MRQISPDEIVQQVKKSCLQANFEMNHLVKEALQEAQQEEKSDLGLYAIGEILDNADIAAKEKMPLCQDTGVCVFFVRWGQDCVLGGTQSLQQVLDEAVRQAYHEGYLRKSMLKDPLFYRKNTGDNTPAVVHLEMVTGNEVEIHFLAKGSGADNCSQVAMLIPADGVKGVKEFVLKTCREAGASSCPPWIVCVGVGGAFDSVAELAKKAMLREVGSQHRETKYAQLEQELLEAINALGIGPQGLGGKVTALAVHIESAPCHAASLPVAVNLQCHSHRVGRVII